MTVSQIRAFFAASASKTYSEAAERLRISPSVLFKSLNGLEDELGISLFTKDKNHLQLTDIGDWLYPHLQYIAAQYSAMERIAGNFRVTLHPTPLNIGCMFFSEYYRLVDLIAEVQAIAPTRKIQLAEYRAGEINEMLHNYSLSAAFIYRELLQDSYPHTLNIAKEPIVALANRRLAQKLPETICLSELADYTFLLMHGDQRLHHHLQHACISAGFIPYELPMDLRVETIGSMLVTSDYVTLIMQSFAEKLCTKYDLAIIPVRDVPPLTLCLVSTENFPVGGYPELESYLRAGFSTFGPLLQEEG